MRIRLADTSYRTFVGCNNSDNDEYEDDVGTCSIQLNEDDVGTCSIQLNEDNMADTKVSAICECPRLSETSSASSILMTLLRRETLCVAAISVPEPSSDKTS